MPYCTAKKELLFLIIDFFQVLDSENGIHRVKNHIVAFHRHGRGLLINLCTVLTVIIMPITVEIAYPVQHIRREYFSIVCKRFVCSGGDFLKQIFLSCPLHTVVA